MGHANSGDVCPQHKRRAEKREGQAAGLPSRENWCIVQDVDYRDIITIEPGKRGGRPCVRGMRIAVADVLGWLASGMSEQQIRQEYPELLETDIRACLAYAADRESISLN